MKQNKLAAITMLASVLCVGLPAIAQQPPQGLMKTEAATEGKTDVAVGGFEAVAERDTEQKDVTELKLSAGGLFSSGNSRAVSVTGAARFKFRKELNQLTAAAAANYARSGTTSEKAGKGMETTLENLQGRIRYDRFFNDWMTGFLAGSASRDRFQGLNLRLNIDPGVAFYIIDQKSHQFWTEIGYDLQHDVRRDDTIEAAKAEGKPIDKSETRHNIRGFVGYNNSLSDQVTFDTGLEYLQNVQDTKNWRLVWDAGINSSIGASFAIATTFTLKYDHNPLPGIEKTDAITAISLVYTLL